MQTPRLRRPVALIALVTVLALAVMPSAHASDSSWQRLESEPVSELGGIRSDTEPIALCTGDTQLNFTYQRGMKSASFESISTTTAGTPYVQQPTEHGWQTGISAQNTGVVAALMDLWGASSGVAPEAFSVALYALTDDPRGPSQGAGTAWGAQADQLLAQARAIAGPHTADDLTFNGDELGGFVVRGQAGAPISGVAFTAELTGATFASTGTTTISGHTGDQEQRFAIDAPTFGEVNVKVTYTKIPGHSFRTGHHGVAQDMHLVGVRGELEQNLTLRPAPEPAGVVITTRAEVTMEEASGTAVHRITDLITVGAESWPVAGGQSASYAITAELYGPFADPYEEQAAVPEGLEPVEAIDLTVTAPGDYSVTFETEPTEGWYTVVVSGSFEAAGEFDGLPREEIVMPFFEPVETVFVELPEPPLVPEVPESEVPESEVPESEVPAPESSEPPTPEPAPRLPDTGPQLFGFGVVSLGLLGLGGSLFAGSRSEE